jgi:hypothetical protein
MGIVWPEVKLSGYEANPSHQASIGTYTPLCRTEDDL